MSARYWGSYFPDLGLPNDLEVWKEFAEKSFIEYRGTYISEMLQKMPKIDKDTSTISPEEASELEGISSETTQFSELVIKVNTPKDLNSLVPFFQTRPPIPQILSFNQLLMTHNVNGPNHAVILHQIDFEKEKLFVIDPTKHQLHEPDVYDFRLFGKAWRDFHNLQIITYPKNMITLISGPTVGIAKQLEMTQYLEEKL